MAREQLFNVAGVSKLNGELKPRWANDLATRIKVLQANDHTEIQLVELGGDFNKLGAMKHLLTLPEFNSKPDVKALIEATVTKYSPKPPKEKKAAATGTETPAAAPTTPEPKAEEPAAKGKKGKKEEPAKLAA